LIAALTVFMGGVGIAAYILAWIIIPPNPYDQPYQSTRKSREFYTPGGQRPGDDFINDKREAGETFNDRMGQQGHGQEGASPGNAGTGDVTQGAASQGTGYDREVDERRANGTQIAGIALVVLGVLFLLQQWFPYWFDFGKLWPLILIIIGIAVIVRGQRR